MALERESRVQKLVSSLAFDNEQNNSRKNFIHLWRIKKWFEIVFSAAEATSTTSKNLTL